MVSSGVSSVIFSGFHRGFLWVSYMDFLWTYFSGKKPLLCVKLLPDLFVVLLPGPAFMSRAVLAQNRLGDGPACDRKLYIYINNTGWGPPVINWFINHYNPH